MNVIDRHNINKLGKILCRDKWNDADYQTIRKKHIKNLKVILFLIPLIVIILGLSGALLMLVMWGITKGL